MSEGEMKRIFKKIGKRIKKILKPAPMVPVIRLSGVIGKVSSFNNGMSYEGLCDLIDNAFEIPNIKLVALSINSPGGSPVQSELIASKIRRKALEKKVEVHCFVEDVAASGGYWLAASADKIYASPNSVLGSIGVISSGFGMVKAIEKLGIERRVHTQGDNKSILDPFLPEKDSDIKLLEGLQKDVHENFINYVKERRKGKLDLNYTNIFSGEFWSGKRAMELGLVDELGLLENVLKDKFGEEVKLLKIQESKGWLKRKLGIEHFTQNVINSVLNILEEKLINSRFKL